jgi:hypothetical protein
MFVSCNKSIQVEKQENNYIGIDQQILNIVDTIDLETIKNYATLATIPILRKPFITIVFSKVVEAPLDITSVLSFYNFIGSPYGEDGERVLISEDSNFRGYKKYKDIYLVFYEYSRKEDFDKFIDIDSLDFDEKIFFYYDIYSTHAQHVYRCRREMGLSGKK